MKDCNMISDSVIYPCSLFIPFASLLTNTIGQSPDSSAEMAYYISTLTLEFTLLFFTLLCNESLSFGPLNTHILYKNNY